MKFVQIIEFRTEHIDEIAKIGDEWLEVAGLDADAEVPGLRAHLEGCPACREEHESLRALVAGDECP